MKEGGVMDRSGVGWRSVEGQERSERTVPDVFIPYVQERWMG